MSLKIHENAYNRVWFFKNFPGDMPPDPLAGLGLRPSFCRLYASWLVPWNIPAGSWTYAGNKKVNEEQNEWGAGKEIKKKKEKKKKKTEARCHSATFFVVPIAYGGLLKYVDGWSSQHWEPTVSRKIDPRPPTPNAITLATSQHCDFMKSLNSDYS